MRPGIAWFSLMLSGRCSNIHAFSDEAFMNEHFCCKILEETPIFTSKVIKLIINVNFCIYWISFCGFLKDCIQFCRFDSKTWELFSLSWPDRTHAYLWGNTFVYACPVWWHSSPWNLLLFRFSWSRRHCQVLLYPFTKWKYSFIDFQICDSLLKANFFCFLEVRNTCRGRLPSRRNQHMRDRCRIICSRHSEHITSTNIIQK